jgi:hypothetical protein
MKRLEPTATQTKNRNDRSETIRRARNGGEWYDSVIPIVQSFDLPIVQALTSFNFSHVNKIILAHTAGNFQVSALLWDEMIADSRVCNALESRISMASDLWMQENIEVIPAGNDADEISVANWWKSNICNIIDSSTFSSIGEDRFGLGVSIHQIIYPKDCFWKTGPYLQRWHMSTCWYNQTERNFRTTTLDGGSEQIDPNNGKWAIFADNANSQNQFYRCWVKGGVKRLANLWLAKQFAVRDWCKYSEVYGNLIKKAIAPSNASESGKQAWLNSIQKLSTGGILSCLSDGQGKKLWDMELLAPPTGTSDVMKALADYADTGIDTAILGQSSTTALAGGAYNAVQTLYSGMALGKARRDITATNNSLVPVVNAVTRVIFGDMSLAPRVRVNPKRIQYQVSEQDSGGSNDQ